MKLSARCWRGNCGDPLPRPGAQQNAQNNLKKIQYFVHFADCKIPPYVLYYNRSEGEERTRRRQGFLTPDEKKSKKGLDKPPNMCYNKHVIKRKENLTNQKGLYTMTKMTYVDALNFALEVLNENQFEGIEDDKAAAMDKLSTLRDTLIKRRETAKNAPKTPTKTQRANADVKDSIVEFFKTADPMQAKAVGAAFEISPQKASALCNQLVAEGRLAKTTEKRVTYFGRVAA